MAHKRLTGFAIVCCLLLGLSSWAQEPSQDGVLLLEGHGTVYGKGESGSAANTLPDSSVELGLNIARDLELISNPDGAVVGGYMLDAFGGQFSLGSAKSITDLTGEGNAPPFFGWDIARDLEVAPDWREVTGSDSKYVVAKNGYSGYLILDGLGGIHAVGKVNLPQYPLGPSGEEVDSPYPEYLIARQAAGADAETTALNILKGGTVTNLSDVRPVFTYFGWDIARDLVVTSQFVTISSQLVVQRNPQGDPVLPSFATVSAPENGQIVGMCNGYYILDGFGAIHSCRLPLQFDVNDDGMIDKTDLESDNFGKPVNNRPMVIPWLGSSSPWFGWDIARDMELTPSGNGCYLLTGYGSVYTMGDAQPIEPSTPFFGFDIARGLALVPDKDGNSIDGYLVMDGFGQTYKAGDADDYNITETGNDGGSILSYEDSFADIEITPVFVSSKTSLIGPRYTVTVAPLDADLTNPGVVWGTGLSPVVEPSFKVSTAPYPFFDYVTGE